MSIGNDERGGTVSEQHGAGGSGERDDDEADFTSPDVRAPEDADGVLESGTSSADKSSRAHEARYRHTRTSAVWTSTVVAVLFAIALIDFIAQNTRDLRVHFFTVSVQVPVSVALLVAAVGGAVVVVAIGVGRVAQLRLTLRRQRKSAKSHSRD